MAWLLSDAKSMELNGPPSNSTAIVLYAQADELCKAFRGGEFQSLPAKVRCLDHARNAASQIQQTILAESTSEYLSQSIVESIRRAVHRFLVACNNWFQALEQYTRRKMNGEAAVHLEHQELWDNLSDELVDRCNQLGLQVHDTAQDLLTTVGFVFQLLEKRR